MDSKVNLSVVIPYMEADSGKRAVLKRCTDSLIGHDELIVVSNWKEGYAKPINKGLAIARGEYMLVMNDDVILLEGDLKELCDPMAVTSPLVNGERPSTGIFGCVFCIPRWVYEQTGGLWEGYEISYFDDDDFIMTLKQSNIPMKSVPSVKFSHPDGGRTLHTFPNHNEFFERNKLIFQKRWERCL